MAQDLDGSVAYSPSTANTHYSSPPAGSSSTVHHNIDDRIRLIHMMLIINAITGWFIPFIPLILGVLVMISRSNLETDKVAMYHKLNKTNKFCLVLSGVFSFIWCLILGVAYLIFFIFIIPLLLAIICLFGCLASFLLM